MPEIPLPTVTRNDDGTWTPAETDVPPGPARLAWHAAVTAAKIGDAFPITLHQEFGGYELQLGDGVRTDRMEYDEARAYLDGVTGGLDAVLNRLLPIAMEGLQHALGMFGAGLTAAEPEPDQPGLRLVAELTQDDLDRLRDGGDDA